MKAKEMNFAKWADQGRNFNKGKIVYYVPDMFTCIKGEVIDCFREGSFAIVTIQANDGKVYIDSSNHFSCSFPAILNYWKA